VGQTGDIGRIPAIGKSCTYPRASSAALSPDKNPFDVGSLPAVARNANSRFFTDCYHQAAAIGPANAHESGASEALARSWAGWLRGAPLGSGVFKIIISI
jgi:hypothetical protein